mgnify:CR=1 FL=1
MTTFSPFAPPLNLNERNGFFDTAGPHCADSTVLPPYVAVTFWINHAGIVLTLRILALAGLHFVAHQHLHFGRVADEVRADFHRIRHVSLRNRPA